MAFLELTALTGLVGALAGAPPGSEVGLTKRNSVLAAPLRVRGGSGRNF